MRIKKAVFWAVLVVLIFARSLIGQGVGAVNMSSPNYKIQWGNFNIGAGRQTSPNYQLGTTLGQLAPGLYTGAGFKVRAGFQYIHSIIPFEFSISDLSIDFGTLTPNQFATATNVLTVSAGGASGYQVLAYETHPLRAPTGEEIPDTVCDAGDCDETTAGVWNLTSTFGFGFNMSGDDIPSDFVNSSYFRQFANAAGGESPQVIMSRSGVTRRSQATVTYKVNVSPIQAAGRYQTSIVFIALPGY